MLVETRKWAWSPESLIALPFDPAPAKPRGSGGSGVALAWSPSRYHAPYITTLPPWLIAAGRSFG